jgi:phosphoesterase RecJ-like protein
MMEEQVIATAVDREIERLVAGHSDAVVVCHEAPDGDAVGSTLALTWTLREMGKTVWPLVPRPYLDSMWDWMPGWETVNRDLPTPGPRLVFVVDAGSLERPGEAIDLTPDMTIVNIDHHLSNPGFGSVNLVEVDAAATCLVLFTLFRRLGYRITPHAALCLYAGIFSDTGGFRHENTTATALDACAELVRLGADPAMVAHHLYRSRPMRSLKLQAAVMGEMRLEPDGVLWAPVTQEMLRRSGASMADTEGVIDTLNAVDGIRAAVLFKEQTAGTVRVSLRTRAPLDADDIVSVFGGGGHARAAGCELPGPVNAAAARLLERLREVAAGPAGRVIQ